MTPADRHVLVAEDNLAMADVVRFNLQNAGYTVTLCRNGHDALETLRRQPVDILITDYQMPGLNGEQLCRLIREEPALSALPVIMVSAKGLELDLDRLRDELNLRTVLYKPFSPRELTRLVHTSLESLTPSS